MRLAGSSGDRAARAAAHTAEQVLQLVVIHDPGPLLLLLAPLHGLEHLLRAHELLVAVVRDVRRAVVILQRIQLHVVRVIRSERNAVGAHRPMPRECAEDRRKDYIS